MEGQAMFVLVIAVAAIVVPSVVGGFALGYWCGKTDTKKGRDTGGPR